MKVNIKSKGLNNTVERNQKLLRIQPITWIHIGLIIF